MKIPDDVELFAMPHHRKYGAQTHARVGALHVPTQVAVCATAPTQREAAEAAIERLADMRDRLRAVAEPQRLLDAVDL